MLFTLLENLKNLFMQENRESEDNPSEDLENALYSYEPNKAYWLNHNSIRSSSVANLNRLTDLERNPYVDMWKYGHFDTSELSSYLQSIFKNTDIQNVTLDISEIQGLSASRSPIRDYSSMDQFVMQRCRKYFEITHEYLKSNLAHREVRITNKTNRSDFLKIYGWSNKIYLMNAGGSHHFASARYIAKELNQPVPLTANMDLIFIDRVGLNKYQNQYSSLLIPRSDFAFLSTHFDKCQFDSIVYQTNFLPADTLLMFYKHNALPQEISNMLKTLFTDFNLELMKFFELQNQNEVFNKYYSSH